MISNTYAFWDSLMRKPLYEGHALQSLGKNYSNFAHFPNLGSLSDSKLKKYYVLICKAISAGAQSFAKQNPTSPTNIGDVA